MKLQDLLAYTAAEFLDDRGAHLVEGDADELWSDKTLVRYFNEAERRLCRRAWVLVDIGNPTAGVLILATDKPVYKLHSSVLRVIAVTPDGASVPLPRSTDARVQAFQAPGVDEPFDVNIVQAFTPGAPRVYTTDAGTRLLRVVPTPAAAQNGSKLILRVARMPLCPLVIDKPEQSPEVPEEWHLEVLAKFAAGMCLTHPNVDASAKTEGRRLLAEVEASIKEARQERQRAEMSEAKFQFASTTACL